MNINNTYFEGAYQHAWKRIIPPGLSEAETDLLIEAAALDADSRVLDLMCGYGRHALALGRRGITVHAFDNLQAYITEVDAAAKAESLPVVATCADVLTAPLDGPYDAAICMGNSFTFFNAGDATTILKNVSAQLKPGGLVVINSWMIAEIAIRHFRDKDWHMAGEYKCVLENRFLFQPSRIETEQTIIAPDGSIETVRGVDYIFTIGELEQMFAAAGLRLDALYSTPRKRRFAIGDSTVYILARKA